MNAEEHENKYLGIITFTVMLENVAVNLEEQVNPALDDDEDDDDEDEAHD